VKSKVAVVTGGGRGLGRALTLELVNRGVDVYIVSRSEPALSETQSRCPSKIFTIQADLSTERGWKKTVDRLAERDRVDLLVHNAATASPLGKLNDISYADWRFAMAVNTEAPVFLTRALLPKLVGGRVLFVSSGAAVQPIPGALSYCACKSALEMVCRGWTLEASDVGFTLVRPGMIDTQMQEYLRRPSPEEFPAAPLFYQAYKQNHLLPAGVPAGFIAWLLLNVPAEEYRCRLWDITDGEQQQRWRTEMNL